MRIKIISDSTSDLSQGLIEKHDIRIVRLSIARGGEYLKDGSEITPRDIFEYFESGKGLCSTSAINTAEYTDVYNEELPNCDAIIHFIISSEMSACYQNAVVAAQEFDNVHVIDTRNLSTGMGHLVLDAAEMAAKGMAADEIVKAINALIPKVDASFVIDTLTYLHKGGRCSGVQKIAAGLLKLKPCIAVIDGKMSPVKKYRGSLKKVLQEYVEDKLADLSAIDPRRIFVTHSMKEDNREIVEMVKEMVTKTGHFQEIIETTAGSTVSCHCGPNTLGILFFNK